jgi:salicylate hydroxylase
MAVTGNGATSADVLVVGGGIGGLSAAYALATSGHAVRLYEQSAEFGEVGAGLQLAPNATRVLAEWGLLDAIVDIGVLPRRLVLRDAVTGGELTSLELGAGFRARYGAPYVVAHRSDLHRILLDACRTAGVALENGRKVERVDPDGRAHCADGTAHTSEVVLGADGLGSALRGSVVADDPVPSGYVAYRGAVPVADIATDVAHDDVVAWIGPGCHLVQYSLRRGEVFNQVAVFRSPAFLRGEADWGGPEELDAAFAHCAGPVRDALGALWRDRWWPMYDRAPTPNWIRGRMVLTGDAAHPMLQYLAQGACQAIEDAHTIAAQAGKHAAPDGRTDWDATLRAFQDARAPRTARVQTSARTWGEIWHVDGVGRLLRNELLTTRAVDDYRHVDWLYA